MGLFQLNAPKDTLFKMYRNAGACGPITNIVIVAEFNINGMNNGIDSHDRLIQRDEYTDINFRKYIVSYHEIGDHNKGHRLMFKKFESLFNTTDQYDSYNLLLDMHTSPRDLIYVNKKTRILPCNGPGSRVFINNAWTQEYCIDGLKSENTTLVSNDIIFGILNRKQSNEQQNCLLEFAVNYLLDIINRENYVYSHNFQPFEGQEIGIIFLLYGRP